MIRPLTDGACACVCTLQAYLRGADIPANALPRSHAAVLAECPRLSGSAQWTRIVAVIEDIIGHGKRAVDFHSAALCRLDAGEYELRRLREELGTLSHRPAGVLAVVPARPKPKDEPRPVALAA